MNKAPLLEVQGLCKSFESAGNAFSRSRSRVAVVRGINFELRSTETLGIVGESGCGKTTLARMLMRLIEPDSGEIRFDGRKWLAARGSELRAMRRDIQMVFQDPMSSLNPRMRVGAIVGEPLAIHEARLIRAERRSRVAQVLESVGLGADIVQRFPHEFSGGQRQRIGIARALVLRPKLLIADEPVSALDVSVGAQILELFQKLQRDLNLTTIFISHSLPVIAQLATNIAVMKDGQFVEAGPAEQVLQNPQAPYTQVLLSAVPELPKYEASILKV